MTYNKTETTKASKTCNTMPYLMKQPLFARRKARFIEEIAKPGVAIAVASQRAAIPRSVLYRWYKTDDEFRSKVERVLNKRYEQEDKHFARYNTFDINVED
jgi:hypothetical protein